MTPTFIFITCFICCIAYRREAYQNRHWKKFCHHLKREYMRRIISRMLKMSHVEIILYLEIEIQRLEKEEKEAKK